jgi:hypothetical protein
VSKSGRVLSACETSKPISVHPRMIPSAPDRAMLAMMRIGLLGMRRRVADYDPALGFQPYMMIMTVMGFLIALGVLLMSLRHVESPGFPRRLGWLEKLTMWVFLAVVAGNIVQAFASTGPPPYVGQSDPIRFSFNPKHWVWSLDEWKSAAVSLRGRWDIEPPDVTKVSADPASGPLANLSVLTVKQRRQLSLLLLTLRAQRSLWSLLAPRRRACTTTTRTSCGRTLARRTTCSFLMLTHRLRVPLPTAY